MSGELKSCPFCGGEGDMSFYARTSGPEPAGHFVECISCAAAGPSFEIQGEVLDRVEYTKAKAAAAWNTRLTPAPDKLDAATVERCVEFVTDGYRCRSCSAVFIGHEGHPGNGCQRHNWDALMNEEKAAAIRNLATDPHQHGGEGSVMCFRDRTFCSCEVHADDCDRRWTPELSAAAERWWGGPGAPVAFAPLCQRTPHQHGAGNGESIS